MMQKGLRLHGIITALVTPFSNNGQVDEEALRQLVQFQIKSGVNGLFAPRYDWDGPCDGARRKETCRGDCGEGGAR